jgi:hypothetical protein
MDTIDVARFLAWVVIPLCTVMYIEAKRDIRMFFIRDVPLFIALSVGVTVYVVLVTAYRGETIYAVFGEALIVVSLVLAVIYAAIRNIVRDVINRPEDVEERADKTAPGSDDVEAFFNVECEQPLFERRTDNIVSDSDDAEVFFDVGREKPLCPAPSEDNTVDEMVLGEENRVVVRYNIWWAIPFGIFFLPMALLIGNFVAIPLLLLGILVLLGNYNRRIIFDDDGITTEESTLLPWSEIDNVDYFDVRHRWGQSGFQFGSKENGFVPIYEFFY